MAQPKVFQVTTSPEKLVSPISGSGATNSRVAVLLSIMSYEEAPDAPEIAGPVFLSFGTKAGLTPATGMPLYPGQTLALSPENPTWKAMADRGVWAVADVGGGEHVKVRVQEL